MNAPDIELALRTRAAFNDSIERIDADTRQRLRNLRLRALQGEGQRGALRWAWPVGAGLAAVLALAMFVPILPRVPMPTTPVTPITAAATTPIAPAPADSIARQDVPTTSGATPAPDAMETTDPELLSNLQFYGWLAKQPARNASGG